MLAANTLPRPPQPFPRKEADIPITADVLKRKLTHFVLWRPNASTISPTLVIGRFQPGNPPTFIGQKRLPLTTAAGAPGLWEVAGTDCQLQGGQVYYYWFEVMDTSGSAQPAPPVLCTDPLAFADCAQAIKYVTMHDVEGLRHERLSTMLRGAFVRQRTKCVSLVCPGRLAVQA